MAVNNEEKVYNEIISSVPGSGASTAALAQAENLAQQQSGGYSGTYNGKLDSAIGEWLLNRGFDYDPSQDKTYQLYRQNYKKNSAAARNLSRQTANSLANGYNPTYADAVASSVYNDRMSGIDDNSMMFKDLYIQDRAAEQNRLLNKVNIYSTLDKSEYDKKQDLSADYKNYLNALATRYNADRQSEIGAAKVASDVYEQILNAEEIRHTAERKKEYRDRIAQEQAQFYNPANRSEEGIGGYNEIITPQSSKKTGELISKIFCEADGQRFLPKNKKKDTASIAQEIIDDALKNDEITAGEAAYLYDYYSLATDRYKNS